jgi:hypothetical protein
VQNDTLLGREQKKDTENYQMIKIARFEPMEYHVSSAGAVNYKSISAVSLHSLALLSSPALLRASAVADCFNIVSLNNFLEPRSKGKVLRVEISIKSIKLGQFLRRHGEERGTTSKHAHALEQLNKYPLCHFQMCS